MCGDDIGLEVVPEAVKVMKAAAAKTGLPIEWTELLIGKAGHEKYGDTLPPGVDLDAKASKTLLTGTETRGYLTFRALPAAKAVEKRPVSVMANVSINFVMKATYSSQPLFVTVAK